METSFSLKENKSNRFNPPSEEITVETSELRYIIPNAEIPVLPSDTIEMRQGVEIEVHNRYSQPQQLIEPPAPPDKYKKVYLIMVLHGVGTLMPWNLFLNAKDYFENYKLGKPYTTSNDEVWYSANFFEFVYWSAQLPNVLFGFVNIIYPIGGSLKKRMILTLSVEVLVCIFTMVMVAVDTSKSPGTFFWLTIISVAVINTAGGLYQNSVYGIASKIGYAAALVLGSNLSGVFVALTSLVILATSPSKLTSALFYFGTATLVMFLCLISYLRLPSFEFYKYYELQTKAKDDHDQAVNETDQKKGANRLAEFYEVFKQCWVQCFNVFMVFFVTLAIFPTIHSNIKRLDSDFIISDEQYFVGVTCFLTFNLFAFIGNLVANWVQWPTETHLWIPVTLRLFFIPFFLFCNYQPRTESGFTRNSDTVLFGDWVYWIGGVLLGLTNGYFSSLAMIYCPRTVDTKEHASMAGMLGAAFLVLGVFVGVNFSIVWEHVVFAIG